MSQLDPDAPYYDAEIGSLHDLVHSEVYGKDSKLSKAAQKILDDSVEHYKKAFETPDIRMGKVFREKLDQLAKTLNDTEPKIIENHEYKYDKEGNLIGDKTTFAANTAIISKMMMEYTNLMEAYENVQAKVKKEMGKVWGGRTPSRLERKHREKS